MYRMPNDPEKAAEEWTEDWVKEQVRRANPLNDVLFKYLFASKINKENLLRLLNDTLGPERRIVDVEQLDRESDPRRYGGRASFLDVLAHSENSRIFHVEVQLLDEGNFFERVTYYLQKELIAEIIDVSEDRTALGRLITDCSDRKSHV